MLETKPLNGHIARKSLSGQIDRLDAILDGLADGLNGAVADAVRIAVGQAVQDAVTQALQTLLTDPALRAAFLQIHRPTPTPSREPAVRKLLRTAGEQLKCVGHRASKIGRGWLATISRGLALALQLRQTLACATSVGLIVGIGCYLAGPTIAAAVGGVTSAAAALATSGVAKVWRLVRLTARN